MVNKVILIGNLGKDPEMTYTASGAAVTKVSLATNERWTDDSGERRERTEWHNLVFWRKQAEIANEYLRKGSRIYVEGRINYRSWEGEDGQRRKATDIVVLQFQMLTPRGETAGGGGGAPSGRHEPRQGGARQRSREHPSDEPHYEPIDDKDQGGGGDDGGGDDKFGSGEDDDLPF